MNEFKQKIKVIIIAIAGLFVLVAAIFVMQNIMANKQKDAAVVQQIRLLNRWETSSFTVEKIINNGNSGNIFQQFLFGNRILLVAHGQVVGGFDLSTFSSKSVSVNSSSITITLPAPQILSTILNEDQTRVYDRQKGILVPANDSLETQARVSAVSAIHQAACSEGILNVTSDNAKKQLTSVLSTFKFTDIKINIPKGSC